MSAMADIGIVRLSDSVADSEDVKKQPLHTNNNFSRETDMKSFLSHKKAFRKWGLCCNFLLSAEHYTRTITISQCQFKNQKSRTSHTFWYNQCNHGQFHNILIPQTSYFNQLYSDRFLKKLHECLFAELAISLGGKTFRLEWFLFGETCTMSGIICRHLKIQTN